MLKKDIPVADVCRQIRVNMEYSSRLQLMHMLFYVSVSDGQIHKDEIKMIESISRYLSISGKDFESIKSMFLPSTDSAYKILEVDPKADDSEVKRAYRRMARKYHPDTVSHLGDDLRLAAEEKFKMLNEAYEKIKKERNIV
jgi:DnaJ like chaperone protein